eukprot:SAG22_NODE_2639_length_2347_cov_2.181940_3_plen_125_part_00
MPFCASARPGELARCFIDAQARPVYVVVVNRFVTSLTELTDDEVSSKALSFCCISTVFLSKTVPFRAVCPARQLAALWRGALEAIDSSGSTFGGASSAVRRSAVRDCNPGTLPFPSPPLLWLVS